MYFKTKLKSRVPWGIACLKFETWYGIFVFKIKWICFIDTWSTHILLPKLEGKLGKSHIVGFSLCLKVKSLHSFVVKSRVYA